MKTLNRVTTSTPKGRAAASNAYESFRNYALSGASFAKAYDANVAGLTAEASDDYTLALAQFKTAESFARKACLALGLTRYP